MGRLTSIDWIILIVYFALTLCIGFYFWRQSRSPEGFTAAKRSMPGWVVGISIFATYLSSISYLALPGKAFAGNWNPFVFSLAIPFAAWISVKWFLPYYRKTGDVSAYANLEFRFGSWARLYAGIFYLLTQIARIGVVTYLLGLPMSVLLGWDLVTIIIITGIITTFYTFIGGIFAVLWTDAIQTVVLLAGAIVSLIVLIYNIDGGMLTAISYAFEHNKFSLGELGVIVEQGTISCNFSTATILVVFLYGFCDNLKNFGIDQSYVQRYQTSKNETEARKSIWLGALLYIPVSALFFLIGTFLFVLYHTGPNHERDLNEVRKIVAHQKLIQSGVIPKYQTDSQTGQQVFATEYQTKIETLAATLQDNDIGDRVFPHFIGQYLPSGLVGLLVAAIFAAGMSTISGSLNASATLILRDYYLRFFRPNASDRESMRVLYAGTIIWGCLGTIAALILIRLTDSALDIWWTLVGIFGGGMLGLFLIGMLVGKARNFSAILAVFTGTAAIFWFTIPDLIRWFRKHDAYDIAESLEWFAEQLGGVSLYHPYMIPVFGTLIMVFLATVISFFEREKSVTNDFSKQ
ncbi:MAG: sodium:solute symporter [Planctomycetaceae bacterium]|jgi:SSS family solute:Na+ symporter|nr:sodium:solute symporter [Planctomycetaceae bacterium]